MSSLCGANLIKALSIRATDEISSKVSGGRSSDGES
jgi:hypothetical protein